MSVRRLLAAGVLVPLLLSGCQESKAEPKPKMPEATSTPSQTSSPPPKGETPQAFIRRWAEVEAEMQNSGDTREYLALSGQCKPCKSLARTVEAYYDAGGYVRWEGWTIRRVASWGEASNHFEVDVNSAPTRYRRSESEPVETLDGGPGKHLVVLKKVNNSWQVIDRSELA